MNKYTFRPKYVFTTMRYLIAARKMPLADTNMMAGYGKLFRYLITNHIKDCVQSFQNVV